MVRTWRAPPDWLDPEQTQEAVGVLEEGVSGRLEPCALGWAGSLPFELQTGKRTAMATRNCGAWPRPPGSAPSPGCQYLADKYPLERSARALTQDTSTVGFQSPFHQP